MSQIPKILQDMYLKNLKFFEKQNPQIYNVISKTTPDHSKIIISDEGTIDLTYKGKNIYAGDAIKYVEAEVQEFKSNFSEVKRATGIGAVAPGTYSGPRFFHKHINKTVNDLYKEADTVYTNALHTNGRYDFLIITGIGLGLHITELLENTDIQNLLILETDFELLALSCFFTDWKQIYEKQSPKKNKSITLTLTNKQNIENEQSSLWNELIRKCPQYPFNTVIYNHGKHDRYGEIIQNISNDVKMFMSLWGFYDDEKNQLNHVMHNINQGVSLIPDKEDFNWEKPVIICGSGPSLDSRMEQLKEIRDNCTLISAGTSLAALLKYNITPDFHVELESDYGVYPALLSLLDKPELKEITLLCAIQCSPYITNVFKNCFVFVKDSMSMGDILDKQRNKILEATPTCVNSAISFALHYKAKKIFLFGTDFGFYDLNNHHSQHSIYNNDDNSDHEELINGNLKRIKENFIKPGYLGDCYTTSTYFTVKRRIDMLIIQYSSIYKFEIFNLSDGLVVERTTRVEKEAKIKIDVHHTRSQVDIFKEKSRKIDFSKNQEILDTLHPVIKNLCDTLILNIKEIECDTFSLSAKLWAISNYLGTTFEKENGVMVYFIRGTMWHYMTAGYTISYAVPLDKQSKIIEIWKDRFIDFLENLPKDLLKEIKKERGNIKDDPMLTKTIREI
jgi:hypothetical protein